MGTLERAMEHERRALNADPSYVPAALTLADLALGLRDTARYLVARDALRRAVAVVPNPPADLLLAKGRLERATDEPDSALVAFERGTSSNGSARDVARLEWARTSLALGSRSGEQPYFEGAQSDDSATVAGYRADLALIAADSELAAFDATRGAARAEWLARFWSDRDRAELRADGERLREHYRRLQYARRHFALTVSRRFYGDQDAYRSGSEELDDRGIIYVRHGEPATRLKPFVFGLMPNETWRYNRADGDLLLHFSAGYDDHGGDLYDYRLVESVLDLRGSAGAPKDQLLLSRDALSPLYGRMLNWGPNGAVRAGDRERAIGRASIAYGTTTDTYELEFARRLTAYASLVAIGMDRGVPLTHFVFALAQPETTPRVEVDGASYSVRVRVVALDGSGHAAAHADTTLVFPLVAPLRPRQYLLGRVQLPVPPGTYVWRAVLEQGPDAGVVLPRDTVTVGFAGPPLALSDLALGIPAASVRWQPTVADTVLLTPFNLFLEASDVELYYEASGARTGSVYRHEIAVLRVRGDDRVEQRPVVSLRVDEEAPSETIRAHRTLRLTKLKPGSYVVEVRVTGPDGASAVRRRGVRVVKDEH
jgi:GWxTD domain-containing protein